MKIVEFFGISGTGKTFLKNLLVKNYKEKLIDVYDYDKIIEIFLPNEEVSIFNRYILKIFFLFRKKNKPKELKRSFYRSKKLNRKINFFLYIKKYVYKIYLQCINNIFQKLKKKKFILISLKLINECNFSLENKEIFTRWLAEETVAHYLIKKNKKKLDLIVDSEGLIQRLFVYLYKKKKKRKIAKEYLKHCYIPDVVLITKKKLFIKKISRNQEFNMNYNELLKIYTITIKLLETKTKISLVDDKNISNLII